MTKQRIAASIFDINSRARIATLVLAALLAMVPVVQAQTLTVLHNFSGAEGMQPSAGLTPAGTGTFYGTASTGGLYNHGTVFKLIQRGVNSDLLTIYNFKNNSDGSNPLGPVSIRSRRQPVRHNHWLQRRRRNTIPAAPLTQLSHYSPHGMALHSAAHLHREQWRW